MRICFLRSNKYSYSETFLDNLVSNLSPAKVLYEGWYPTVESNMEKSFLPFPFNYLLFRGGFRNLFPKLYHSFYNRSFAKYLQKENIDLVFANYGPMGVAVRDACKLANKPILVHFHGFDASDYKVLDKYKYSYKEMFRQVGAVVVVSNDMKQMLMSMGAEEQKVYLNPYSVNSNLFTVGEPEKNEAIFIYVGRFAGKKNPSHLIRSFSIVLKEIPEAKLIMIGDGPLWDSTMNFAEQLGISKNIEFRGKRSPEEIADALKEARCFIQHSVRAESGDMEGTPNTILEASCSGLPVVSTTHAGIKEAVVHGVTGFLVEENDWEGMAAYMIELGKSPSMAQQMGRAGVEHIRLNYSLERQMAVFENIFQKLTANKI